MKPKSVSLLIQAVRMFFFIFFFYVWLAYGLTFTHTHPIRVPYSQVLRQSFLPDSVNSIGKVRPPKISREGNVFVRLRCDFRPSPGNLLFFSASSDSQKAVRSLSRESNTFLKHVLNIYFDATRLMVVKGLNLKQFSIYTKQQCSMMIATQLFCHVVMCTVCKQFYG